MKVHFVLVLVCLLLGSTFTQSCLDGNGNVVNWWVKLLFPGTVPGGYAYFDSSYVAPAFVVNQDQPDSANTPLTLTLSQINSQNLQSIAWNDQWPNGTTSSTKAHSKGVLAYNEATMSGFFLCHSIPQYPAFSGFTVNVSINASQQIYGQHAFCFTADSTIFSDMITKLLPIKPYIYATNLNNLNSINNLLASGVVLAPDYSSTFTYKNRTINSTDFKFIYKNGAVNASIFQDGLNNMLQSPMIAQTWGRSIQVPWCGTYPVGNAVTIKFSSTVTWNQTQDHSKWAYSTSTNYSCFGDMNRMTSQFKRGGAYYCIDSPLLKQALVAIVSVVNTC